MFVSLLLLSPIPKQSFYQNNFLLCSQIALFKYYLSATHLILYIYIYIKEKSSLNFDFHSNAPPFGFHLQFSPFLDSFIIISPYRTIAPFQSQSYSYFTSSSFLFFFFFLLNSVSYFENYNFRSIWTIYFIFCYFLFLKLIVFFFNFLSIATCNFLV